MNQEQLKDSARELRKQLNAHLSQDESVAELLAALEPLLTLAETGAILQPIDSGSVPGSYLFTEKGLRAYNSLDKAYAHFCIAISGREKIAEALAQRWKQAPST